MRRQAGRLGMRAILAGLLVTAVAFGAGVPTSLAYFSKSAAAATTITSGTWSVPITYFLHNAVPNTAATRAIANLTATTAAPTSGTLWAYNTDCPGTQAGRTLASTNASVAAICRYVNWMTPAYAGGRRLSGNVVLTAYFWLDSDPGGKNIVVDVTLNDYNPASGARTAIATLTAVTWASPGNTTPANSRHAINVAVGSYTVPANDCIEVIVRGNMSTFAQRNVVVAYDTTAYPATLALP